MLVDLVLNTTDASGPEAIEAACAAEQAGFVGVWAYDHLSGTAFGGDAILETWTLLGAIAASTSRVTIGPLVANTTIRHPALLATAAATLQSLSGGRVILGLGAGAGPDSPFAHELSMVGLPIYPAPERRDRVREAVEVILGLWSGRRDQPGEHFPLVAAEGFVKPDPAPPIIIAANGPKMAALAGEVANGAVLHGWDPNLETLIEVTRSAAAGRSMTMLALAPFDDEWRSGPKHDRLAALGVDRLALAWRPEHGLDAITR